MSAPAFALAAGLVYTALGFMGFAPALLLAGERLFGLFPVDASLNALHLVLGFWGLFAWSGALGSVSYARGLAVVAGVLAVLGLYGTLQQPFALLPVQGHDVWLHAATAVIAAWFGFRSLARREMHAERRHGARNRRVAERPVAMERRGGTFDRRQAQYGGSTLAAG
jgi:hypothetical protein